MFRSIYSTTACEGHVVDRVVGELQRAWNTNANDFIEYNEKADGESTPNRGRNIYLVTAKNPQIPTFGQPIIVRRNFAGGDIWKEIKHSKEADFLQQYETIVFVDVRGMTSINVAGELKITSAPEYAFTMLRAKLSAIWAINSPDDFRGFGAFPMRIFTFWLGDALGNRMGLNADPRAQQIVNALIAYYWCGMLESSEPDESTKTRMAVSIGRATYIVPETSIPIMAKAPWMQSMDQFIKAAIEISGSMRLEKLSRGFLVAALENTWRGFNSAENIAVALEHPPTFLAMVYTSFKEVTFKHTKLGDLAKQYNKGGVGMEFVKIMDQFLDQM